MRTPKISASVEETYQSDDSVHKLNEITDVSKVKCCQPAKLEFFLVEVDDGREAADEV